MKYVEVAPSIITGGNNKLTYSSERDLKVGTVVKIEVGQKSTCGIVLSEAEKPDFKTKKASEAIENLNSLPQQLIKTIEWMSDYYATPLPLCVRMMLPKNIAAKRRIQTVEFSSQRSLPKFKLTPSQQEALQAIESNKTSSILHGETGSGKTAIYRELIKKVLRRGKNALVLVPEIGLSTQLAADLSDLTEHIYVTHSALTEAQRHIIWMNILQQSQPCIVVGPRSSLFSPLSNLGVVIIDEEHETGYKQDVSPRYHAQAVAAFLVRQHNAKLVLGSATPRIQDVYIAKEQKLPVINLPRLSNTPIPEITVIDLTNKAEFSKNRTLSDRLISQLSSSLKEARQSLIYLNRRGTASIVLCTNCGWYAMCSRCELPLKLHHDSNSLRCHLCGVSEPIPSSCPVCQSVDIIYKIPGTKEIEREIKKLFPTASIARFDGDNLSHQRLERRYDEVYRGDVDIIVGTQSIARGLDLPKLSLVGVISADSELTLPDFSSSERAFQLLHQVTGRVGRNTGKSSVVVQTAHPKHPAIEHGINHNYQSFYDEEIKIRMDHGYPPFRFLLVLIGEYSSQKKTINEANKLAAKINKTFSGVEVLGPTPAFYEKRGGKFRWIIAVKSAKRNRLVEVANKFRSPHWQVDLDPINLLY